MGGRTFRDVQRIAGHSIYVESWSASIHDVHSIYLACNHSKGVFNVVKGPGPQPSLDVNTGSVDAIDSWKVGNSHLHAHVNVQWTRKSSSVWCENMGTDLMLGTCCKPRWARKVSENYYT